MQTDETKHDEIVEVVGCRKPCRCQTEEHIVGDETPHYCCDEEQKMALWSKFKKWLTRERA